MSTAETIFTPRSNSTTLKPRLAQPVVAGDSPVSDFSPMEPTNCSLGSLAFSGLRRNPRAKRIKVFSFRIRYFVNRRALYDITALGRVLVFGEQSLPIFDAFPGKAAVK